MPSPSSSLPAEAPREIPAEDDYQPTLVELLAESIPTELTATAHVGIGSARRLKIAWAVLPVAEVAVEQARADERRKMAEQIREIVKDDGPMPMENWRAFVVDKARHKRVVTGDSVVAVLLAVADEIEGDNRG